MLIFSARKVSIAQKLTTKSYKYKEIVNTEHLQNPIKYLGNELSYIKKVLESESWSATGGSWNQALEKAFAQKIGTQYAVALNSGTATLHAGLEAAGIGYGDEDDGTTIESTLSVYIHTSFEIKALEEVATAVLLVDYDDGFIAYLNGVEVARSGICSDGIIPAFDNSAEI